MRIDCICPPRDGAVRHPDGDSVTLRERLDFFGAQAAQNAVYVLKSEDPDASTGDILAAMTESYLLSGIESWSVVDADGKPVEPTKPAIRKYLFANFAVAMVVAQEADTKYRSDVIDPLVKMVEDSSASTPTEPSTSPTSGSDDTNQNHSSPSSISTIQTVDTETTSLSPVGASSSSQN